MKKIYKVIKDSLLNLLAKKRYQSDFSDASFFEVLSNYTDNLHDASLQFNNGNILIAQKLVVNYFRTRKSPSFFLEKSEMNLVVNRIKVDHPEWLDQTINSVQSMIKNGIKLFEINTQPLSSADFWYVFNKGSSQDILYQVLPHRFGFAPKLILAQHYGVPTLKLFDQLISKWLEITSKDSLSYLSDLTVISRLISLSWAWFFLTALDDEIYSEKWFLEYRLLKIIHADSLFLSRHENQSAPNNHLMVYEFSKFYIATLFPEFADIKNWTYSQPASWIKELRRQSYVDGGGFEPSLHYHQLLCETGVAYILLSRANQLQVDSWVQSHLKLLLKFQIYLGGSFDINLHIGDSSDHELFPLSPIPANCLSNLREFYRFLYNPDFRSSVGSIGAEQAFWLLGGKLAPKSYSAEFVENNYFCFKQSGYYILGDAQSGGRLVFRTGPGKDCEVFAGHMHSDLLSVYVDVNDVAFIVNSGTYTYRGNIECWHKGSPLWRRYFMGVSSNNTIYYENQDPLGELDGDFRDTTISARVQTSIEFQNEKLTWIECEINNAGIYSSLKRGIVHLSGFYWLIYNIKGGDENHKPLKMSLQLNEGVIADEHDSVVKLSCRDVSLKLAWSPEISLSQVLNGSHSPLGGWISKHYGELTAATQLIFDISDNSLISAFAFAVNDNLNSKFSVRVIRRDSFLTELHVNCINYNDIILLRNDGHVGILESENKLINATAAMILLRCDSKCRPIAIMAHDFYQVNIFSIDLSLKYEHIIGFFDYAI